MKSKLLTFAAAFLPIAAASADEPMLRQRAELVALDEIAGDYVECSALYLAKSNVTETSESTERQVEYEIVAEYLFGVARELAARSRNDDDADKFVLSQYEEWLDRFAASFRDGAESYKVFLAESSERCTKLIEQPVDTVKERTQRIFDELRNQGYTIVSPEKTAN